MILTISCNPKSSLEKISPHSRDKGKREKGERGIRKIDKLKGKVG